MKKFLNFFEKYGMIKMVISILLLALFSFLFNKTHYEIFSYIAVIPALYIMVAFILLVVAGIWNVINDFRK